MNRTVALAAVLISFSLSQVQGIAQTKSSIEQTCTACSAAGHKPINTAVQSPLRQETSLIGLSYINYIYQNDLTNAHMCEAMLLMNSQVPAGTANPYVHLWDKGMGEKTLAVLEDVQLAFDYSIGRSVPADDKMQKSIDNIKAVLKKK